MLPKLRDVVKEEIGGKLDFEWQWKKQLTKVGSHYHSYPHNKLQW